MPFNLTFNPDSVKVFE